MKPSEFITKFKVYKEQNNIILKPITFEDLDLRFIDREELKDKINNILNGRYKPWFEKVNGLKEEILEMLK